MTLQTDLQAAVDKATLASDKLHDIVNGDSVSTVTTDNGEVKTLAKAVADNEQVLNDSIVTLTTKRDEAVASATAAATSQSNAATSENNANNSAGAAALSEANAASSETGAATSLANAQTAEANASGSAAASATSETNANASAVAASNSASSATTSESNAALSATTASTSASNASTSATDAASSAAAAASSAAGQLFSDVIDLSFADSPFTISATENGNLYRVDTSAGDVEIILPDLTALTADFRLGVAKGSADVNVINVNRTGTDTINGLASRTLSAQYNIDTYIGDKDNNVWYASGGGLGAINISIDQFNGDGVATVFNLSGTPGSENNTSIFINGVYQQKSAYTVTGNQITFSEAPPVGGNNIEVVFGSQVPIGVPSNDTVDTVHLKNSAVTAPKIATQAVTLDKIVSGTPNKLLGYGAGGNAEEVDTPQAFLAGMLMPYASTSAPTGWLLCDGSAIDRTTYADLFTLIGTTYGAGDGSTTFNIPDLRGRIPTGLDNMGGASANRITNTQADTLGGTGGNENVTPTGSISGSTGSTTLSTAQIPSHTHTYQATNFSGSQKRPAANFDRSGGDNYTSGAEGGSGSHNHTLSASFSGNAMNITQPWLAMNYIIKT